MRRQIKMAFLGSWLAFSVFAYGTHSEAADNSSDQSFDFTALAKTDLPSKRDFLEFAGSYTVAATFDRLPANQHGRLLVEIVNHEDFDLPITEVTASCGCTRATLMSRVIPANKSAKLEIKIDTPKRHSSGTFKGRIVLEIDNSLVEHKLLSHINVNLKFEIGGLLCFHEHLVSVEAKKGKIGRLRLPFVYSLTTELEDLQLETFGILEGVTGEIVASNEGHHIAIDVDPALLDESRGFGWLKVTDPASGSSGKIHIVVNVVEGVVLSPHTIHFKRLSESSEEMVGRCIVRVRRETERKQDALAANSEQSMAKPPALTCDASIGSHALKIQIRPVNHKVYRLSMSIPAEVAEKLLADQEENSKDIQLSWKIISGAVVANGVSQFAFSRFSQTGVK
tara:strand:- start:855 stop:2039 length:1185 start_codon:yes stop_codon:yes gene_type:complete